MITITRNGRTSIYVGQYLLTLDAKQHVVKARINGQPETSVVSSMYYDRAQQMDAMPRAYREKALEAFAHWAVTPRGDQTVIA